MDGDGEGEKPKIAKPVEEAPLAEEGAEAPLAEAPEAPEAEPVAQPLPVLGPAPVAPPNLIEDLNSSQFNQAALYLRNTLRPYSDRIGLLNACDCWKDFIQSTTSGSTKNLLFEETVKKLFGPIPGSWQKIKDRIVLEILEDNKYGETTPIGVCWVEAISQADIKRATRPIAIENNHPVTKLPSDVILGAHDSGYNPLDMSKDLQLILTPGSYIDPAYRKKLGDNRVLGCFGQGKPITRDMFVDLGFKGSINIFNSELKHDGSMAVFVEAIDDIKLQTLRGTDHNTIANTNVVTHKAAQIDILNGFDFFGGNPTKNRWFIDNSGQLFASVNEAAILYVLSKLLGDALQVIYLFMIIYGLPEALRNTYVNRVCMFTTDNVVLARCRELRVACCCQSHLKKEYENLGRTDYWCPSMSEERRIQVEKDMYLKRCEEENKKTIVSIENLLSDKNEEKIFLMNGQEYDINDNIRAFLTLIIQDIGVKIDYAKGENTPEKTAEEYHKICIESTALKLVDCFKVLTSAKSVFITNRRDIIRDTGMTFGQKLYRLTTKVDNNRPRQARHPRQRGPPYNSTEGHKILQQQGGGNRGIPEKDFMQEFYDIILNIIRRRYVINPAGQPFNHKYGRIDYILINQHDIEELYEDIAYDFLCHMSIFLNYVRYSCLDDYILSILIQQYIRENTDYIDHTSQRSPIINFARFFFNLKKIDDDYTYTSICKRVIEYYLKVINSGNTFYAMEEYKRNMMILQRNYGSIVTTVVGDLELGSIGQKEQGEKRGERATETETETGPAYKRPAIFGGRRKNTTRRKKSHTNKRTQNSSKMKCHTKKRIHHSSKTKRKAKGTIGRRSTHKK